MKKKKRITEKSWRGTQQLTFSCTIVILGNIDNVHGMQLRLMPRTIVLKQVNWSSSHKVKGNPRVKSGWTVSRKYTKPSI